MCDQNGSCLSLLIHVLQCVLYPHRFVLVHCVQRQAYFLLTGYSKHLEVYLSKQIVSIEMCITTSPPHPQPTPALSISNILHLCGPSDHFFIFYLPTHSFIC